MHADIKEEVAKPQEVEVSVSGNTVTAKGPKGEVSKELYGPEIKVEADKVVLQYKNATKKEKRLLSANTSHVENMIKGVQEPFTYKLKICSSHFPMKVNIEGQEVKVNNYLGEKTPRTIKMKPNVEVKIDGTDITVQSCDIEQAGNMASDLELMTRSRGGRDVRIFQDGIYITEKPGRGVSV